MKKIAENKTKIDKEKLVRSIHRFTSNKILVIGDLILDKYTLGECNRISPEAPVPVLNVRERRYALGGAGNTAANIKSLGSEPYLVGILGVDGGAGIFKKQLKAKGIDSSGVFSSSYTDTIIKERLVAMKPKMQQFCRLDYNDRIEYHNKHCEHILDRIMHTNTRVVVISDYAKGTLPDSLIREVVEYCKKNNKTLIIDPRPQHTSCYENASFITPNFKEACEMIKKNYEENLENAVRLAKELSEELRTKTILTMAENGILFCDSLSYEHFKTFKREVSDVSGAGDSVVAALAVGLANKLDVSSAIYFANHAGGVKVEKAGVQPVSLDEVIRDINLHNSM